MIEFRHTQVPTKMPRVSPRVFPCPVSFDQVQGVESGWYLDLVKTLPSCKRCFFSRVKLVRAKSWLPCYPHFCWCSVDSEVFGSPPWSLGRAAERTVGRPVMWVFWKDVQVYDVDESMTWRIWQSHESQEWRNDSIASMINAWNHMML